MIIAHHRRLYYVTATPSLAEAWLGVTAQQVVQASRTTPRIHSH
jgi:hypothetical protein